MSAESPTTPQAPVARPPGFFQRLKTAFSGAAARVPQQAGSPAPKKKSQRILLVIVLFALGAAFLMFFKRRASKRAARDAEGGSTRVADGVRQIRYWKRRPDWDSPLTVTLIETSDGLQLLDEADPSDNGVITVYLPKSKSKGGKRCFSLVRQKAVVHHRQSYQPLKTDCVSSFRIVKRDFKDEIPVTLTLHSLPRGGFEGVIDYLKESQVIPS